MPKNYAGRLISFRNEEYPYQTTTKEIEKSVENDELDSVNRYDQNLMSRYL